MYWYRNVLLGSFLLAGFAFSPIAAEQPAQGYQPTGDEIAGLSVRFGSGYGGRWGRSYYRGGYYNPYGYSYRYGYPGYYRYNRPWRYNYYNPNYYYYGRPYGGVYFRFGD